MKENNSKEHEIDVLTSVFNDSRDYFDGLGYSGYRFESRQGEGVPDGLFCDGKHTVWIEHTQANLNYGEKGSLLHGYKGFCIDVQRELLKEGKGGCLCFDIPSTLADEYLHSKNTKKELLGIARRVIAESKEYVDTERNIHIQYCKPLECRHINLEDYNGFRVMALQFHNVELCQKLPQEIYDKCVSIKEQKYKDNQGERDENWLFIEIPWGHSFGNDLPKTTNYFDKIFIVERKPSKNKEIYAPKLLNLSPTKGLH